MRPFFPVDRLLRALHRCPRAPQFAFSLGPRSRLSSSSLWRSPPWIGRPGRRTLRAAASGTALGAVAFVELSEKDNSGTEQTAEKRMLEASRTEIDPKVAPDVAGLARLGHDLVYILDRFVWEPLCTGVRLLQLVVIFVPVIAVVPVIWLGKRRPDRDGERSGTLWWYGFLVQGMEKAGPAFIKVRLRERDGMRTSTVGAES